jgi:hypothetical protein
LREIANCKTSRLSRRSRAQLPPDAQDEIALVVLRLIGTDDEQPVLLTPDEQAAVSASKAAAARGEFATEEQVRAMWAKHRL